MLTRVAEISAKDPNAQVIADAAKLLRTGGLVAFPTETVYGLGANALDSSAIARIYEAKGRPSRNPLIVHVGSAGEAQGLVAVWPEAASRLVERFWPGPLTLVLPKAAIVPDIVTAGGSTLAVRVPSHPVALALLRSADVPIAAPSANRSSRLSPTRAEHVLHDLEGRIDLVLDGGPTAGGIESTVLDLTTTPPRLLRPGLVTPAEIEALIGPIARGDSAIRRQGPLPSPGLELRHYAPRARLHCVADDGWSLVTSLRLQGCKVGWLTFSRVASLDEPGLIAVAMPREPTAYAARLYAELHALDDKGVDCVVVEMPPDTEEWLAVRDRLLRASASSEERKHALEFGQGQ